MRLAECLREKGVNAVPVFWAATEDHDFDEIAVVNGLNGNGETFSIANRPTESGLGLPVGSVLLDTSITATVDAFCDELGTSPFIQNIHDSLERAYLAGRSIGRAFCSLVADLFARFGLIVVDPTDERLKALASPIYAGAAGQAIDINRRLLERDVELKADGYHSQVLITPEYVPFFYQTADGVRRALKMKVGGDLAVSGTRESLTQGQLLQVARNEPARLSPAVMLRPVVQDFLFPTICYFGGGAEIAYFAQNSVVYDSLRRPVTTILHRQSFTVMEARHRRTLNKFGLSFLDLFRGYEDLVPRVVEQFVDPKGARIFADAEESVNVQLNKLDQYVSQLDPTLADNLARRRRKIIYHIAALRTKFERARLSKDAEIDRRIKAAIGSLLPEGNLQERSINVFTFISRYGPQFLDRLYESIDLDDKGHRLIEI
jgi:bacillithiol biosynthesis cysteine-adding enzyme BshC